MTGYECAANPVFTMSINILIYFFCSLLTNPIIRNLVSSLFCFVDRKCGGLLKGNSGSFASPNYPSDYPHNVTCLWVIRIPKATSILVTVDDVDIGPETGDFLAYSQDGSYPSEQKPVKINSPGRKELTFQGDTALFEFVSDGKFNARGFFARYNSDLRQNTPGRVKNRLNLKFRFKGYW